MNEVLICSKFNYFKLKIDKFKWNKQKKARLTVLDTPLNKIVSKLIIINQFAKIL